MRRPLVLAIAALAAIGTVAAPAASRERLTGQQKLAKMLEGRVAGEPRDCLNTRVNQSMTIIDKTALVYGSGRTIWVNVPRNADQLDDDDILVSKQFSSDLCRLDMVSTVDRTGHFWTGPVMLTQFVPYTRAN